MSSQQVAPLTKGCSNETTSRRSSKSSAAWKWTLDCLVGVETRPELEAGVAAVEESSFWPEFSAESMSPNVGRKRSKTGYYGETVSKNVLIYGVKRYTLIT